jgi:hypothetical protein
MLPESAFALAGHNEITNVSDENNRESGLLIVAPEPTLTGKATITVAVAKHNKSKRAKVFILAIYVKNGISVTQVSQFLLLLHKTIHLIFRPEPI